MREDRSIGETHHPRRHEYLPVEETHSGRLLPAASWSVKPKAADSTGSHCKDEGCIANALKGLAVGLETREQPRSRETPQIWV